MQHLGEVCTAQRSRGKSEQDKRQVKARKGFSNRRFERRFWVLLPPWAKVPRARRRGMSLWTIRREGVPRLWARRADVGIRPYARLSVVIP